MEPIKVVALNSLASGHYNPARRIVTAIAAEGGLVHYFTEIDKQSKDLQHLCHDKISIHHYFPEGEVDGRPWCSPDAPSPAGWYSAGIQVWEFGKRSSEAAQRTVMWLRWLIDYIKALGVDVIIGEMHAPWAKIVAKSLDLPYVTMCPMRLWNVQECLEQICSEMDGVSSSPWYNPVYEYVQNVLGNDDACKADPQEHHRRLSEKLEKVLLATDMHKLVATEFAMTLTYSDKSWCNADLCMFMGGYSSFNVQFTGEVFAKQPPRSEAWFPNVQVHPVGPYIQAAALPESMDPEVQTIMDAVQGSTDATPIVFVALGTIDSDNAPLFRKVVRELCTSATPYLVIVRCGGGCSPDDILASAERKENCFITSKFLPQQSILARTSVFVTHCGMGSLNEALAFGVPCLLFPTDIERYGNAVIMDQQGLGLFLLNDVKKSSYHSPLNYWWHDECAKLDNDSISKAVADLIDAAQKNKDVFAAAKESTVGDKSSANLKNAVDAILALKGKTYKETEGKSIDLLRLKRDDILKSFKSFEVDGLIGRSELEETLALLDSSWKTEDLDAILSSGDLTRDGKIHVDKLIEYIFADE